MPDISLTDYGSQLAEIQRRQRLAQMLSDQGQQDIPIQSYNGIQAPIPWTALLAKTLQTGLGAYQAHRAERGAADIAAQQRDEARQYIRGLGGVSGQAMPLQTVSQQPDIQLAPGQPQMPTGPSGPAASAQAYAQALGGPAPAQPPPQTPPPQPGYADTPPMTFTPQQQGPEVQNRLLEASMSGNPYLEKVAPALYAHNQALSDKADERSFQEQLAASKAQAALQSKLLYDQLKPPEKTAMEKDYGVAKGEGYKGSFMDYVQFAAPKFINTSPGQLMFNQRSLTPGAPGSQLTGEHLEALISQGFPGAVVTSGPRTPAQNAAVGGAPNSAHLTDSARDFTLPTQQAMQQAADAINQQGLPGVKAIYEGPGAKNSTGPHVHVEIAQAPAATGPAQPVAIGPQRPVGGGVSSQWMLTQEEKDALNKAVGEGRVDLSRLNSRTAKITAGAMIANPGFDAINNHAFAQLAANSNMQQKAMLATALPDVLQNVRDAGKKLQFSDVQFVGKLQAFAKGQLNDPDFVAYMSQRNDAMQTLAQVMSGVGATDMRTKMESDAAPKTLSPRAWDAWYQGQLNALAPRIARYNQFHITPPPGRPAIPDRRVAPSGKDLFNAADAILKGG